MADYIQKLEGDTEPREGDVEITVMDGAMKGTRYSVRPKPHASCHGTGRIVRIVGGTGKKGTGVPDICDCVRRPVTKEVGMGVQLDARFLSAEQRAKIRRERLGAEIGRAKGELAELLQKRDALVEQCRQGAAEARGKVDALASEEQAVREALSAAEDDVAANERRLTDARKALAAAEATQKHAALTLGQAKKRLDEIAKARAMAQDTAAKLEREAARPRPDLEARIKGAQNEVARLELEQKANEAAQVIEKAAEAAA